MLLKSWKNPKYKNEIFYPDVFCVSADFKEYVEVDAQGMETDRYKADFINEYMYGPILLKPMKLEFTCHNSISAIDILCHLN